MDTDAAAEDELNWVMFAVKPNMALGKLGSVGRSLEVVGWEALDSVAANRVSECSFEAMASLPICSSQQ